MLHVNGASPTPDGATAGGGPWPPLQYASRPLCSLLCLSIRLNPSFSGPWTRHPAISFLVFLFVSLRTAFRTSFFGIAVSCILSIWPSHLILWLLINLTMFSPLIMASNSSFCRVLHNSFSFTGPYIFRKISSSIIRLKNVTNHGQEKDSEQSIFLSSSKKITHIRRRLLSSILYWIFLYS